MTRGVAFVAMFFYHAAWFAHDRGLVDIGIGTDPGWRALQRSIAGTFYLLVGVSLVLANRDAVRWRAWAYRMGKLVGAASIVTAASFVLEPRMLVTYGILHNIAVCSAVGLLFLRAGPWNLGVALLCFALDALVSSPVFDAPWLRWTGLGTTHAPAFDFQPFFPWFGVVCAGLWAGAELARAREGHPLARVAAWYSPAPPFALLALMGQWSLFLYMAHVPVLVVTVEIVAWLQGI